MAASKSFRSFDLVDSYVNGIQCKKKQKKLALTNNLSWSKVLILMLILMLQILACVPDHLKRSLPLLASGLEDRLPNFYFLVMSAGAAGPAISAISLIAIFFQRLHNVFVHIHLVVLQDLHNQLQTNDLNAFN